MQADVVCVVQNPLGSAISVQYQEEFILGIASIECIPDSQGQASSSK